MFRMTGAPTSTIETVTVVRPIKVIACLCGILCSLFLVVAVASTEWLNADGYRGGLWVECYWQNVTNITCNNNPKKAWVEACGALMVIALLLAVSGTILNGVGLCTQSHDVKYKLYRIAMYLMFIALICIVISVIVFPVMFIKEIHTRGKTFWEFAWAYGFAWGGAVFCAGAAFMLLCDKESDEIYYREKITYPSDTSLEQR